MSTETAAAITCSGHGPAVTLQEKQSMIKITQLKLPVGHKQEELEKKVSSMLKISPEKIRKIEIFKRSLDARKKPLMYNYQVGVFTEGEEKLVKKLKNKDVTMGSLVEYKFPKSGEEKLKHPPVIIGAGPAGLFCAYLLAKAGYEPIVLERGQSVEERKAMVDHFWETGELNPQSNVQFGEGGAGTFSDGKLNTLVKDQFGRSRFVLKTFVQFGATDDILYENKPHIGTDILIDVVRNLRNEIIRLGGLIRFNSQVTDIRLKDGQVKAVEVNHGEWIDTDCLVVAIGHSARDTFEMLWKRQIPMRSKSFAVGVRMEHPQKLINENQYGKDYDGSLPAAAYKLTRKVAEERGVYSFCMCPGGYVVNASSEEGMTAVNGMSYHARAGENANSAMIISVRPEDFGSDGPLAGVEFQRQLERAAYREGQGKIPVQLFGDFCKNKVSKSLGDITPCTKGQWTFGNVRSIFPENLARGLEEGILGCENLIPGFAREDALVLGVESRTSSPVRMEREDKTLESAVSGLYPCGEGAGYAGGIMSAAMDGIKVAEAIALKFKPWYH